MATAAFTSVKSSLRQDFENLIRLTSSYGEPRCRLNCRARRRGFSCRCPVPRVQCLVCSAREYFGPKDAERTGPGIHTGRSLYASFCRKARRFTARPVSAAFAPFRSLSRRTLSPTQPCAAKASAPFGAPTINLACVAAFRRSLPRGSSLESARPIGRVVTLEQRRCRAELDKWIWQAGLRGRGCRGDPCGQRRNARRKPHLSLEYHYPRPHFNDISSSSPGACGIPLRAAKPRRAGSRQFCAMKLGRGHWAVPGTDSPPRRCARLSKSVSHALSHNADRRPADYRPPAPGRSARLEPCVPTIQEGTSYRNKAVAGALPPTSSRLPWAISSIPDGLVREQPRAPSSPCSSAVMVRQSLLCPGEPSDCYTHARYRRPARGSPSNRCLA